MNGISNTYQPGSDDTFDGDAPWESVMNMTCDRRLAHSRPVRYRVGRALRAGRDEYHGGVQL